MDTVATPSPIDPVSPPSVALTTEDEETLTKVDPNYKTALRISAALTAIPFMIGSVVADGVLQGAGDELWPFPYGVLIGVVVFVALVLVIRIPGRRWQARGYNMSADRLRVVRGILFHSDTVVPFGRVQHIDVDQGPIERALGIATLTLHTAGNHNASVTLPGLQEDLARDIREDIRARIKRDTV
ncbi:MAG: PH domain-containing protein [Pseudomonadota bacterium]